MENYHVIEVVGEGSFGKVRSGSCTPVASLKLWFLLAARSRGQSRNGGEISMNFVRTREHVFLGWTLRAEGPGRAAFRGRIP